jgi:hypothetical protein
MHWISLKWVVKVSTIYKEAAWRCIQAPERIKMIEPYNITNATNATGFDNYTSYISEEFTQIVSISVFISFSFIFLVGLLGNSLVVMGELFEKMITSNVLRASLLRQSWRGIQQCVRQQTSWLLTWPWLICFLWYFVRWKRDQISCGTRIFCWLCIEISGVLKFIHFSRIDESKDFKSSKKSFRSLNWRKLSEVAEET